MEIYYQRKYFKKIMEIKKVQKRSYDNHQNEIYQKTKYLHCLNVEEDGIYFK